MVFQSDSVAEGIMQSVKIVVWEEDGGWLGYRQD